MNPISMQITLAIYCVAVVLASAIGGVLPLVTTLTHTRMQVFLSFAAGIMLGAVFFHMLPEAVDDGGTAVLSWACVGLLVLFFLERYFSFHQHESLDSHSNAECHENHSRSRNDLHWGVAAIGLAVHTLIGGFALASAVAAGDASARAATSWGVFLATLVHKPADSLTIVGLMLRSHTSRRRALLVNFAYSLLVPAGVGCFFIFRRWIGGNTSHSFTSTALAFSAGTFLCIALSDLLPELQFHRHDRVALSGALLIGIALMAATGWLA